MRRLRGLALILHRVFGLSAALFLFVAGVTGSIVAFQPYLREALDPPLRVAASGRLLQGGLALRARAQALVPTAAINTVWFHPEPGKAAVFRLEPRLDPASGKPFPLAFDRLALDPYSGEELRRFTSPDENLADLVLRIHYSLAIPEPWGRALFGIVALGWTFDCFMGLWLTFPASGQSVTHKRRSWLARWWRPSWLVKPDASRFRRRFDLHRAGSLWLWPLLLVFAWSGVALCLPNQVYQPVMAAAFGYRIPTESLMPRSEAVSDPTIAWEAARRKGRAYAEEQARRDGFSYQGDTGLAYLPAFRTYLYAFRSDRDLVADEGQSYVLFDAGTGQFIDLYLPTGQRSGNTIDSWILAIHFAAIGGFAFRCFVAVVGLMIAFVALTGVWVWWFKRRIRTSRAGIRASTKPPPPVPSAG